MKSLDGTLRTLQENKQRPLRMVVVYFDLVAWFSNKIVYELVNEIVAFETLRVAEEKMK
ncbi:MAG: hypothetical protein LBS69_06345 [Prevotellaceae bacterium]|jgi:hypothetical protein|nr:hypothetical protein [Prevotellaceae bacterium]